MPRFSSSDSTSSGIRPFTRTAYIPGTYLAGWHGVNADVVDGLEMTQNSQIRCHLATQLDSGSMTAMTPS